MEKETPTNPLVSEEELTVEDLAEALMNAGSVMQEEGRPGIEVEQKKRGRKAGGGNAQAAPASISYSGEELVPLIQALDGWVSTSMDVLPKTVEQCREIANAFAPVLTKYAGESINRFGPEMALVAVLAKCYVPTYLEYNTKKKLREAEEQEATVVESQTPMPFTTRART